MRFQAIRTLVGRPSVFLLVVLLATAGVLAQDSSLNGTVKDPQGNVVPGAEITITNASTGAARKAISDDVGRFQFAQVSPGTYEVKAELTGFKTSVVPDVLLQVDTPLTLNLQLELGELSEVVTVTSQSVAVLNTLDATIGNNFNERQVVELPLNSRNVVNLLTLQPGVSAQGEVSGARRDQSNLTLDGIDVNDQQQAGSQPGLDDAQPGSPQELVPVLRITPDSVQEFRVTVSNPSASQGRSSGGQVSLITKSGSNDFHGSLYEFHRNTVTTANNFFNNRIEEDPDMDGKPGIARPVLLRNLFGGSVGGPMLKDKAFFFFNYEGRRDRSQSSVIRVVPLPHLGQGQVRYESAATGEMVTLSPNDILALYPSTGGVNSAATAILAGAASRYPANDNGQGDQINSDGFRFNGPTPLNQNTYIGKLDFNLTDRQQLYVRGNYQWDTQSDSPQFPDTPLPTIWSHPIGVAVGHTWALGSTLTNTFRYGLTRQAFSRQGDTGGNQVNFRFVYFPLRGQTGLTRTTPTHNFTNDTSWVKGNHTFQFGTNIRVIRNNRDSFNNAYDNGTTNPFFYPPNSLVTCPTGDPCALEDISGASRTPYQGGIAAVLGRLPQYTANFTFGFDGSLLSAGTPSARTFATEEYDLYAEDSWQITPNLTLNYGLRWGLNVAVNETTGFEVAPTRSLGLFLEQRLASAAAGTPFNEAIEIDTAGPFYGKSGYYPTDKNNFMPRVSAAWSPSFKNGFLRTLFGGERQSVFRGGFAMTYDRVGSQLAVTFDNRNTLGFNSSTTISANTYNVTDNLAPQITALDMDIRGLPGINTPDNLVFPVSKPFDNARRIESALNDDLTTPVNYSWNFSIGRELPGGLFVEASYVGRLARNLLATLDVVHPNNIVDPISGQSFYEAARILEDARKANIPIDQIPPIPFIENFFPDPSQLFDASLTPTQNAFLWASHDGFDILDWTFFQDFWNNLGAVPNLFFHPQYAAFQAFSSVADSDYHGLTINARERFGNHLSVDFNYTWSKSIDNATQLQGDSPIGGSGLIRNPIHPEYERSVSDFDTNHIVNANWLWDLPFGRGLRWGSGWNGAVDAILGGWSINGVLRWNSGRPIGGPFESGRWNTNWQISNNVIRIRDPNPDPHKGGDQPNYWADPQFAYNSFRDTYAGEVGDRNVYRASSYFSLDFGLHKAFKMPYNENHQLVFRWEVFNATNTQALAGPSNNGVGVDPEISAARPNFGVITSIQGEPRVMQFGLRFEF